MTALEFDREAAREFITALYPPSLGDIGLIEINWEGPDQKLNRWARFLPTETEKLLDCAEKATREGRRVYFGAGLRSLGLAWADRSTNEHITHWGALVWDFDDKESAEWGLQKARDIGLEFQYVVQTGAIRNGGEEDLRVQCWCLLDQPTTDIEHVRTLLMRGIGGLGSDKSIHDPRRVMRLPGSVAFARKDGRVDEQVVLRDDLAELRNRYTLAELDKVIGGVTPKKPPEIAEAEAVLIRERIEAQGDAASIWRESSAVNQFLADLQIGVEMNPSIFGLAQAAARDGHPAPMILAHLQALLDISDAHGSRPQRAAELLGQLPGIVSRAVADAGMAQDQAPYMPAAEEFDAIDEPEPEVELDPRQRMFARFVYVHDLDCPFDLDTREPLTSGQFNRLWAEVGNPVESKTCAWAVFSRAYPFPADAKAAVGVRRVVKRITYRPGQPALVREPDGHWAANNWTASLLKPAVGVTDADVQIWTDHVRFLCGDVAEHVFDYFGFLLQHPERKINHAILIKSVQGAGKGMMMEPIQLALGDHNVKEIGPADIAGSFNAHYLNHTKLVVVDEMETTDRINTGNKLKPLIAAPPHFLQINDKNIKVYQIPNLVSLIFFTNLDNPVKLELGDRRFCIIDCPHSKKGGEYYAALREFYEDAGAEKVAGWLMERNVSAFEAHGPAPMTAAKREMTEAGRNPAEEWVEEGIKDGLAPFDTAIVCLEHVLHEAKLAGLGNWMTGAKLAALLRRYGARPLTDGRVWGISIPLRGTTPAEILQRGRLFSVRRHEMLAGRSPKQLAEDFKSMQQRAQGERNGKEFAEA